jgi:orotate phosphoribosyltransferase
LKANSLHLYPNLSPAVNKMAADLESWKADFLKASLNGGCLRFGTFELKSGRISPYFFNAGDFYKGTLLRPLAEAYARAIDVASRDKTIQFDVVFGPAYKGIPLAATALLELVRLDENLYGGKEYSFDRKEAKDHGEGGTIVGAPLKGRKVVIVDDVISAGTAKREAVAKIQAQGGEVAGIIVALDRQETLPDGKPGSRSAIGELREEFGIPILAILTLDDIIAGVKQGGILPEDEIKRIEAYKARYGASS